MRPWALAEAGPIKRGSVVSHKHGRRPLLLYGLEARG